MRRALMLTLVIAASITMAAADGPTAWFGTPLPPPVSDVRKPVMKYDDTFAPLPTAFAHRQGKYDELLDAAALKADQKRIVNIGMTWETSVTEAAKAVGVTNESPFLFDLWKQASRCFGVATYQSAGTTVSGDLGGYRPLDVPMTQMIQSGTFYHASGDVYEAVPAEGLERAARFHAFLIEQADQAPESSIAAGKGTPYQSALKACPQ